MPEVRKHATNAQRQAAYRKRKEQARTQQLSARSLPPLPAIPSMPGEVRWATALKHAQHLLESTLEEMEQYYDDRSEDWQEGARLHVPGAVARASRGAG